jgi:long-chain acyl-CoA synthetase
VHQSQLNQVIQSALEQVGIATEVDTVRFPNIVALFEDAFERHSARKACTSLGYDLTYGDLDVFTRDFAAWLQQESGLKSGDRVAVQMPNLIQYWLLCWAFFAPGWS